MNWSASMRSCSWKPSPRLLPPPSGGGHDPAARRAGPPPGLPPRAATLAGHRTVGRAGSRHPRPASRTPARHSALHGSRLLGVHAWGDCNRYLRRRDDSLTLTVEHRAASAPAPIPLILRADDDAVAPAVRDRPPPITSASPSLDERIVTVLADACPRFAVGRRAALPLPRPQRHPPIAVWRRCAAKASSSSPCRLSPHQSA